MATYSVGNAKFFVSNTENSNIIVIAEIDTQGRDVGYWMARDSHSIYYPEVYFPQGTPPENYVNIWVTCTAGTESVISIDDYEIYKFYNLGLSKSNSSGSIIQIAIPQIAGTYSVVFTLSNGQTVNVGSIVVGSTANTYQLTITLSNGQTINAGSITTPVV